MPVIPPISAAFAARDRPCTFPPGRSGEYFSHHLAPGAVHRGYAPAGTRRWAMPRTGSPQSSANMVPMPWLSTFPDSCSPRTITSSTSSPRDCLAPTTLIPTRAFACPPPWPATRPRWARTRRPPAMKTSTMLRAFSFPVQTPRGRIPFCTVGSRTRARAIRDLKPSLLIRAAPKPHARRICTCPSFPGQMSRCTTPCCTCCFGRGCATWVTSAPTPRALMPSRMPCANAPPR